MIGLVLSQKYKIIRLINGGTFCKLYEGIHLIKNTSVAIKAESSEIGKKILDNEINMYLYLNKHKINIPRIKYIGIYNKYKYIVMDLFDINLKDYCLKNEIIMKPIININNENNENMNIDIYNKLPIDFSSIVYDIYYIVESFHKRLLVHRDIKPENFIFDKKGNLYIIDLGLSSFESNRVLKSFIGNKLYSSYNCHLKEYIYTKNDDLISVSYMLLHLYTGILPWNESSTDIYKLKKETNFIDFYKLHNKYDIITEKIIKLYHVINKNNQSNKNNENCCLTIDKILSDAINSC